MSKKKVRKPTKAQMEYLCLKEMAQHYSEQASSLREKHVAKCKHPHEMIEEVSYLKVAVGVKCTFCGMHAKTDEGEWVAKDDFWRDLKENCKHPTEWRDTYKWEHDNGYGRQHWREGEKCRLCYRQNSWPGMSANWWKPDYVSDY